MQGIEPIDVVLLDLHCANNVARRRRVYPKRGKTRCVVAGMVQECIGDTSHELQTRRRASHRDDGSLIEHVCT